MPKQHHYSLELQWTGNKGTGTSDYRTYDRSHTISAQSKPPVLCSSDPAFRGDKTCYNPEELLVASLSSCHMLWFLHLAADLSIVVTDYSDSPTGTMVETANGGGCFSEVTLRPSVSVAEEWMLGKLDTLHKKAHELCFIANSVNFPVYHKPAVTLVKS
jgi:organic hydroperoxide reductase OsmC/OhrA